MAPRRWDLWRPGCHRYWRSCCFVEKKVEAKPEQEESIELWGETATVAEQF